MFSSVDMRAALLTPLRLFGNLLTGVILSNTQKITARNRKLVEVGLTKTLSRSDNLLAEPNRQFWPPIFLALLDMFTLPQDITYSNPEGSGDITELDPEEAGFQSSFSKLGASEKTVRDPTAGVEDSKVFAAKELAKRSNEKPGMVCESPLVVLTKHVSLTMVKLGPLIEAAQKEEQVTVTNFVQFMATNG